MKTDNRSRSRKGTDDGIIRCCYNSYNYVQVFKGKQCNEKKEHVEINKLMLSRDKRLYHIYTIRIENRKKKQLKNLETKKILMLKYLINLRKLKP